MQPGQGAVPYTPQQPVVTGHPISVGVGVPVVGQFYTPTSAMAALILAILGWFSCGLLSIPAVIMAGQARQITNSIPNHPEHGTAQAAQILGWLSITLWAIVIGFYVALVMLSAGFWAAGQ